MILSTSTVYDITTLPPERPPASLGTTEPAAWPSHPTPTRVGTTDVETTLYTSRSQHQADLDYYPDYHLIEVRIHLPMVGAQPMGVIDVKPDDPALLLMPSFASRIAPIEQERLLKEGLAMAMVGPDHTG